MLIQAGAFLAEIANNRPKPIQLVTVQNHLCECAAWGLLELRDLQRLAQEGGADQDLARTVHRAVQQIGLHGAHKELRAELSLSGQFSQATHFQIQVWFDGDPERYPFLCQWGCVPCDSLLSRSCETLHASCVVPISRITNCHSRNGQSHQGQVVTVVLNLLTHVFPLVTADFMEQILVASGAKK